MNCIILAASLLFLAAKVNYVLVSNYHASAGMNTTEIGSPVIRKEEVKRGSMIGARFACHQDCCIVDLVNTEQVYLQCICNAFDKRNMHIKYRA